MLSVPDILSDKVIALPRLHPGQVQAFSVPARFRALRCGRRWGKTAFLKTIACDFAAKGAQVGWFSRTKLSLCD